MSEYGRLWEDLFQVRAKIEALTVPRGIPYGSGFPNIPEKIEDARARVQKRKDELDKLLAEWVEIEKRMTAAGEP